MSKYVVHMDEVPVGRITGRETRDLINGKSAGSRGISLRITDVLPGETCFPGHIHTECEEVILILSGKGEIKIGEETFPMKKGDAVYLPTGLKHLIRNDGEEVMRMACSFSSSDISRDLKNDESMEF
jgi:mannose-6-phosphate isomerase-like protein (cupin superfamily)